MLDKDHYLLLSISEVIEKILKFTKDYKSAEEIYQNDRDFDATMMNFIVIGESVGKLSDNFKKSYPEVDWNKINGLRNIIAHQYFGINVDIVWQVIKNDIPQLKNAVESILNK